jgi:uncharacterized alkaline shock family protein YloU
MIHQNNEKGSVNISASVYTEIVGTAAANCFGVKGMAARSVTDGVYHLLRKESVSKGVRVQGQGDLGSVALFVDADVCPGIGKHTNRQNCQDGEQCQNHGENPVK